MKRTRILSMFLIPICLSLSAYGCGAPKEPSKDQKVVVKINKYKMTVEDFRDSARAITGTKEVVLEHLITRNILIQEAQKENFDKDKAFMKEIERYWEQALLKLLIQKKTAEFYAVFKGDHDKIQAALEKWVKDLRSGASIKIYKETLDEIKVQ